MYVYMYSKTCRVINTMYVIYRVICVHEKIKESNQEIKEKCLFF